MKTTRITAEFSITRSEHYQSVKAGAVVEIDLEEGDKPNASLEQTLNWLASRCTGQAEQSLTDSLARASSRAREAKASQ